MTTRQLTFASLLCGALTAATMPFLGAEPAVIALSFPLGALTMVVGHELVGLVRANRGGAR